MSADNKTEKATPRRKQKSREKGNVARSRELPSALAFSAVLMMVWYGAAPWVASWRALLRQGLELGVTNTDGVRVQALVVQSACKTALWSAPVGAVALAAVLFGSLAQSGIVFAPALLAPKLERLSPASRIKNLFSSTALVQMAKSVVVATVLSWLAYSTLTERLGEVAGSPNLTSAGITELLGRIAFPLCWKAALVLCVWAAVDYGVTRWKYERDLRMSRDELREEAKESEGDPQMKGRIRRLQRQMRRRRMLQDVKRATVVVTNPTHYAIALEYGQKLAAPMVVAKGRDLLAAQIKQVANWHGVPMVENPPLAHALYRTVEVGQAIPARLYTAVAEILAFVYRAQAHATRPSR